MRQLHRAKFVSYFLVNVIVVLALIALMLPLGITYYASAERNILESRQAVLENGMAQLGEQLRAIELMVQTLGLNESIIRFYNVRAPMTPGDHLRMNEARRLVQSVVSANSLIYDVWIHFYNSDAVLSNYGSFAALGRPRDHYALSDETIFDYLDDPSLLQGKVKLLPGFTVEVYGNPTPSQVAFCYLMPFTNPGERAAAFLLIEQKQLERMFETVYQDVGGMRLTDAQGVTHSAYGMEEALPEDAANFRLTSTDYRYKLTATAWIPKETISRVLQPTLRSILYYAFSALAAGLAMSAYSAYRSTRPVRQILEELRKQGVEPRSQSEAFAFLKSSFQKLYRENTDAIRELEANRQTVKSNTLERYLRQNTARMEADDALRVSFPDFPEQYVLTYGLLTVAPNQTQAQEGDRLLGVLIGQRLQAALTPRAILHMLSDDAFILILPVESNGDALLDSLDTLVRTVNDTLSVSLAVTRSRVYRSIRQLNQAYEQARAAMILNCGREDGGQGEELNRSDLPAIAGHSLYNALVMGRAVEANQLVRWILLENDLTDIEQRYYFIRMMVIFAMRDNVYAAQSGAIDEMLPKYPHHMPPERLYDMLRKAVHTICGHVARSPLAHESERRERVVGYLRDHFAEYDLSAQKAAVALSIGEKAVHEICKHATGLHVSAYIQQLRLERAAALLRNTDQPVNQIFEGSGYNTINAFYKAFKRVYGRTPSQYREDFYKREGA